MNKMKNYAKKVAANTIMLCMILGLTVAVGKPAEAVGPVAGVTKELQYTVSSEETGESNGVYAGVTKAIAEMSNEGQSPSIGKYEVTPVQASAGGYSETVSKETISENIIQQKEVGFTSTVYTTVSYLNIRSSASKDAEVIDTVPEGTALTTESNLITYQGSEVVDTWTKLKDGGWVKTKYISETNPLISLGTYYITYYCPCSICCGKWSGLNRTASGAAPVAGVTIAADESIPFGTEVILDGRVYTVQDRGGAINGNHIDVYCNTHSEALASPTGYRELFVRRN